MRPTIAEVKQSLPKAEAVSDSDLTLAYNASMKCIDSIFRPNAEYSRLSRTLEVDRWAPILQIWHDSAEMSYVARQP